VRERQREREREIERENKEEEGRRGEKRRGEHRYLQEESLKRGAASAKVLRQECLEQLRISKKLMGDGEGGVRQVGFCRLCGPSLDSSSFPSE
jgi:hypothetical protein